VISSLKSEPGTYALILRNSSNASLPVGRWRKIGLEPGYYLYIGSAFGPGRVRARLSRHFRDTKVRHWHIDYLREYASPLGVWISYDPDRLEHHWAQSLYNQTELSAVKGFGCSDCDCYSHLFHSSIEPDLISFFNTVESKVVWELYE